MKLNRRQLLKLLAAGAVISTVGRLPAQSHQKLMHKAIPSSGEQIPAVGMGSSRTFNVGDDPVALKQRTEVLSTFFELGGTLIDSSPMYGSSEAVIGHALKQLGSKAQPFSATKVWTSSGDDGPSEIEQSRQLWSVNSFDLLQVHNLVAWEEHLETLFAMKEAGQLRYVGITTSHGRRHAELEKIMRTQPIDFVQASYNIVDREMEQRILPLAAERNIAFIANRPYRRGNLIDTVKKYPLPDWAKEIDCDTWAAFLLKFIISHPAVANVIPATSRVDHMQENMAAMIGRQPDANMRQRMINYVEAL